jgi:E3 ubiquitin-protein ligase TRIP12
LLLTKVPEEYKPAFRREGVFHEIEALASRSTVKSKDKDKDKDKDKELSESPSPADSTSTQQPLNPASSAAATPGFKKLSSLTLEPDDAITLRARVIRFKHVWTGEQEAEDSTFDHLQSLVTRLSAQDVNEKTMTMVLRELAELFASPHSSVSSFELLQSGLVDGLLQLTTDENRKCKSLLYLSHLKLHLCLTVSVQKRREMFFDAFVTRKVRGILVSQAPFSTLVKRLQESLTRMESFEVVSVAQGVDGEPMRCRQLLQNHLSHLYGPDSKRSSPSLLARQLRLRLVAGEDSDIPRNLHNVVVSIHAIATFQALHDYLRPRVSGLLTGNPRLSGMLAALATSGLGSSASRNIPEAVPPPLPPPPPPPPPDSSLTTASNSTGPFGRRRSLRLSAKNATASEDSSTGPAIVNKSIPHEFSNDSNNENTNMVAPMDEPPLAADFTDDEMEAEVSS